MQKIKSNWPTLLVVVTMSFMATLDSSIVNIALPVMSKQLAVSLSSIEWVIASYSIIICSTLLLFGRLGDMKGKSRIFMGGTMLFTAGSLMCGLCRSFAMLVICRFIQGVGASAYMANNQGIITEEFSRNERGKALGILAAAVALGTMIGPPVGGFIVSFVRWNFIFLINVPIGIAVFLMSIKYLPKSKKTNEKMDVKGAVLQFAGTLLFFGAFIEAQKTGFENASIIAGIFLSFILAALFIKLEIKDNQPLLELSIFKNQLFSVSLACALFSFMCISASTILLPFYLQDTMKITPAHAGLFMMISPLIIAILSPLFGAVSDRIGSECLTMIGLLLIACSFWLMSFLNEHSLLLYAAIFVSTMAVGQSMFQPANNTLIMSSCPKNKLGIAGSVNSLVRNLGQIIGITLSTTLLYNFMSIKINHRVSDYIFGRDDVFVFGMQKVFIILMIICFIGAAFTAYRLFQAKHNIDFSRKKQ